MITKIYKILQRESFYDAIDENNKVAFSSDPSLGLPLIPLEDDVEIAFKQEFKNYPDILIDEEDKRFRTGWQKGYKAAKAKKYTEVDIWKVIFLINDRMLHHAGDNWSLDKKYEIVEIIKSLTPSLKAIELEMELFNLPGEEASSLPKGLRPKLTKDNYVIVKQWIYETQT